MFPPHSGPFIPSQDDLSHHFNSPEVALAKIDRELASLRESIRALHSFRNTFIPVSRLPPKVLTEIFSFVQLGEDVKAQSSSPNKSLGPGWLAVTRVSQHWRSIAHSSPTLWTQICSSYSQHMITDFIKYSKTAPLSVYCDRKVERVAAFVSNTLSRISDLDASDFNLDTLLESLSSPAPLLTSLQLHILTIAGTTPAEPTYIPTLDAPLLQRLELSTCCIDIKSPLSEHLTVLKLHAPAKKMSVKDLLNALRNLPRLALLSLSKVLPHVAAPSPSNHASVTLSSLKSLSIAGQSLVQDLDILSHISFPIDTTLHFQSYTRTKNSNSDITDFLNIYKSHLERFSTENCSIDLVLWSDAKTLTLHILPAVKTSYRLGRLSVDITGPWHDTVVMPDKSELASLMLSLPYIKTFTTDCMITPVTWINLCEAFPKLTKVHARREGADNLVSVLVEDFLTTCPSAIDAKKNGGHGGRQPKGRGRGRGGKRGAASNSRTTKLAEWYPILPELENLEIWNVDFTVERIEELIKALSARKTAGKELKTLHFLACKHVLEKKKELKALVGSVTIV